MDLLAPVAKDLDILVLVDDVLSLNRAEALEALYSVTEPTGWGRPIPVNRGPDPESKVKDVHLLIIRHREYRHAPDLSPVVMEGYERTIQFFSRLLLREPNSRDVVINAGEDFDSLCQIGRIIATNFHHKYRDVRGSEAKNRQFFAAHLKQRYINAVVQWRRQAVNVFPDDQTLSLGLTGDLDGNAESYDPTVEKAPDYSYLLDLTAKEQRGLGPRQKALRAKLVAQRAAVAKKREESPALDSYLATMPHEARMTLLSDFANKDPRYIDPEAKRLAQKKLSIERVACRDAACPHACIQAANVEEVDEDAEDDAASA